VTFVFSANNLFDVNARRHASILKDYAPLTLSLSKGAARQLRMVLRQAQRERVLRSGAKGRFRRAA
jgi:hypothetical protein